MPRVDLFTPIHKAIRALVYDLGLQLQTADLTGPERQATIDAVDHGLELLDEHHVQEEQFVFPDVRRYAPDVIDPLIADHREIEGLLSAAGGACEAVRTGGDGDATAAGDELNRRFNELVAGYFGHLAREELTIIPATWEHFDDGQLEAMRGAIIGSQTPERTAEWLSWMARGLTRHELAGLLAGARPVTPPAAYEGMVAVARAALTPESWEAVAREAQL